MTRLTIYVSVVLCLITAFGCAAPTKQQSGDYVGTKQQASVYHGPYGKYINSQYADEYMELRPDGSFSIIGKERIGGKRSGPRDAPQEFNGTYEIKRDIVTLKPIFPSGTIPKGVKSTVDLTLKGNTLVDAKGEIWIKR